VTPQTPWEPDTPDEDIEQDPGIPGRRQGEEKPPELDADPEPPESDDPGGSAVTVPD
jgi:hypothetical protein